MVEPQASERLAAAAARGSLIEIPNAEHQVILDSAQEVIRILREFLARHG
jgi:pimeloyl-ACP methyl ester carboxylesterase